MSAVERDWDIGYFDEGPRLIVRGHGMTPDEIQAFHDREWPRELGTIKSEEVCLHYMKRVKRCSNYDGWGCDMEGEWHSHWFGVQLNPKAPDTFYTLIWHEWPPKNLEPTK